MFSGRIHRRDILNLFHEEAIEVNGTFVSFIYWAITKRIKPIRLLETICIVVARICDVMTLGLSYNSGVILITATYVDDHACSTQDQSKVAIAPPEQNEQRRQATGIWTSHFTFKTLEGCGKGRIRNLFETKSRRTKHRVLIAGVFCPQIIHFAFYFCFVCVHVGRNI